MAGQSAQGRANAPSAPSFWRPEADAMDVGLGTAPDGSAEATSCMDLVAHCVATIHSQAESVPWLMTQQRFELLQMVCHVIDLIGDTGNYTKKKLPNMS